MYPVFFSLIQSLSPVHIIYMAISSHVDFERWFIWTHADHINRNISQQFHLISESIGFDSFRCCYCSSLHNWFWDKTVDSIICDSDIQAIVFIFSLFLSFFPFNFISNVYSSEYEAKWNNLSRKRLKKSRFLRVKMKKKNQPKWCKHK